MTTSRSGSHRFIRNCLVVALAALAVVAAVVPSLNQSRAQAQTAARRTGFHAVVAPNPLANITWGNYSGAHDELFQAYRRASGTNRQLLGQLTLRPRMRWFGAWYTNQWIYQSIQRYIADTTHGNPNVLVQMAIFRMVPWETRACTRLPTAAEQNSYKTWINRVARAIGRTHVAMVLQPDLPFAFCVPHHSKLPLQMVAYASRTFSALPNTTVYIDAGAADWSPVYRAVTLLKNAGIAYARGFALNATHYDSTNAQILFGAQLQSALTGSGFPGKRFVVNTAANGRPFTHPWYVHHGGTNYNNAAVCQNRAQTHCVTPGIPPTLNVTSAQWGLSAKARSLAGKYCDAFLWIGRPWLDNQASPFDLQRALQLARTMPFR